MSKVEVDLPQNVSSAALARGHAAAALRDARQAEPVVDDAKVIVTELVTNAVLHGREPIRLTIIVEAAIRLEVFDSDPHIEAVVVQPLDQDRVGGRGLLLVEHLAAEWGTTRGADGKTIWAGLARVADGTRPI